MKTNHQSTIRVLSCLAALAAMAVLPAFAEDKTADNPGQLSSADYKFAKEAARGGMLEVNLGNVASANSHNAAVQQFGQQMVKDHGAAGQKLQAIASQKGATLPAALTEHQQKEVDRLSKLNGPEFDKAYMAYMVRAHKIDEKAFKKAAEDVQDADLRAWAAGTLPMVQQHLKMAQDLDENVKHQLSSNP